MSCDAAPALLIVPKFPQFLPVFVDRNHLRPTQPRHLGQLINHPFQTGIAIPSYSPPTVKTLPRTSHPMPQRPFKMLEMELELLGDGRTSVYGDLDYSQVRVTDITSSNNRVTTAYTHPCEQSQPSPRERNGRPDWFIKAHQRTRAYKPTTLRYPRHGPEVSGGLNLEGAGLYFRRLFLLEKHLPCYTFHLDGSMGGI